MSTDDRTQEMPAALTEELHEPTLASIPAWQPSAPALAAIIQATPAAALSDAPDYRDRPCRCPSCKYGTVPGVGAVLYSGPDATARLEALAIRDGRIEDATDYGTRAHLHIAADFDAAGAHVRQTLWAGWRRIEQMTGTAS